MKTTVSSFALATLVAATYFSATSAPAFGQSVYASFENAAQDILAAWDAPGAVVGIVKEGDVVLLRGFGSTHVSEHRDVTPTTLTSVASVTKTINATAFAMLVSDGALHWDDPVIRHIPEFRFADSYRTEHTTIRDLITHRAGLPPVMGGLWSMEYSMDKLLSDLPAAEPRIDFRQRVDYSQVGLALLGEIVDRASGMSWPAFVEQRIFVPLGMERSYAGTDAFLRNHPDTETTQNLMGRAVLQDGRVVDGAWRGVGSIYAAAGGVITTAEDMVKFMLFLLAEGVVDGKHLLSPERIDEMLAPQEVEGSPYGPVMNPYASVIAYCLGWIAHEYAGRKIVEHPGSNFGSSVIALIPDEKIGVFISSGANFSLDSDRMVSALKLEAFDYALGLPDRDWKNVLRAGK